MSPHSGSTRRFCIESGPIPITPARLIELALVAAFLATAARSVVVILRNRKRRMAGPRLSLDKILNPEKPALRKEDSGVDIKRDSKSPQSSPNLDPNSYLQSLQEETLQPHLVPIHPWIAPPTPLPGPYDAPYYPLPLPTIRSSSQEPSTEEFQEISTRSYTRRPSANSELGADTVLAGSTTVSSQGWKRTQWTVSAG
ncbi:hypothetical protein NX059_010889 [Plenodomus lindquistii]|nr:hypothetical protein NX059_010889 [Plenodomus lindquistii]